MNHMNRWFFDGLDEFMEAMVEFQRKRAIFRNKDVLRDSYQPDQIEERDEEIEQYKKALQPIIDGWEPNNIFLYGNTGVGKTVVTDALLDQLNQAADTYDDVDLTIIKLNCANLSSSYQVAVHLVNRLRPPDNQISTTGHPQQSVFNKLYKELNAIGGVVLLILDEIDVIGEDDTLLYELPRARANGYLQDVKPGIIGISNDFKFRDNLGPRVRDTLCDREINFAPYNADELRRILEVRAEKALQDGVLEEGVIELCGALAAKDRGSARQALNLLLFAGELAESNDDGEVTVEHVEDAQQELEKERIIEGMHKLTQHGHLVLFAITTLAAKNSTPTRFQPIYDQYVSLSEDGGYSPLGQRAVHNHLNDLEMLGILTADENRTGSPGNYHIYQLDVPLASVLASLEEELQFSQMINQVRKQAVRSGII